MPNSTPVAEPDLERPERDLWHGTPRQGILVRPADLVMIPFGVLWIAVALRWKSVLPALGGGSLAIFAVSFALVGFYATIGRFVVDAWQRSRTSYRLTSRRVVIRIGSIERTSPLSALGNITLMERRDGSGTIAFRPALAAMVATGERPSVSQIVRAPAFASIPDARNVYERILEAQRLFATGSGATVGNAGSEPLAPPRHVIESEIAATRPRRFSFQGALVVLGIGGIACFMAGLGALDWYNGLRSADWPIVPGVVLESTLRLSSSQGGSGRTRETAQLIYQYEVAGHPLYGRRVSYGSLAFGSGARRAGRLLRMYPRGATVAVHYDPGRPDQAVLQPGWTWGSVFQIGLSLFGMLFALGFYKIWTKASGPLPRRGSSLATR